MKQRLLREGLKRKFLPSRGAEGSILFFFYPNEIVREAFEEFKERSKLIRL